MTDIDFDELDKAVNSLMNQRGDESIASESAVPSAPVTSATPVTTPTTTPATPATPAASTASAPSAPIVSTPPTEAFVAPSPAISKRPAGRFMDVVHPSSDMTNNRPAPVRPSRTGISLQPTSQPTPSAEQQSVSEEVLPAPTAAELAMADALEVLPVAEQATVAETTPEVESVEQASSASAPAADDLADKIAASLQESAATAPLESPFLTDAVVEKRPLGSASEVAASDVTAADTVPEQELTANDDTSEQPAEADVATEWQETPKGEILAPELSKDIMAIESSEVSPSEVAPAAAPVVGADIPQQYTPEADTAPEPAPMFDAASLTPEHDAAPKKKSGVLTVLLILLFALLGVAGGAAAYFFLLQ